MDRNQKARECSGTGLECSTLNTAKKKEVSIREASVNGQQDPEKGLTEGYSEATDSVPSLWER